MLPKIKLPLILFLTLTIAICSCSHNNSGSVTFESLNDSLAVLNGRLRTQNDSLYKNLEQKLQDEKAGQNASLWYPKAQYLRYRTDEINRYIQTAISVAQADSATINSDSLYEKLNFYKDRILRIDRDIYESIKKNADIITGDFDAMKNNGIGFQLYLSNKSKDEKLFILNQILHNIKTVENQILIFCNTKIK